MSRMCALTLALSIISNASLSEAVTKYLGKTKDVQLDWTYDEVEIEFTITVNTTGWVGLGFSPNGGMVGSDVVIGWVTSDGQVTLQDRHATGEDTPILDPRQDYHLISGKEENGQTILEFSRRLDTGDQLDARILGFTTKLIFAYNSEDPVDDIPFYHGASNRGSASLYLLSPEPEYLIPNDSTTVELRPDAILVPTNHTAYWCSLVKVPELSTKYHIVKYEPLITPGNEDMVHHILVAACYGEINTEFTSYNCLESGKTANLGRCQTFLAMWTVGGGPTYYSEEAGYPIGGGDSLTHVLMEIHYSNVHSEPGRTDTSGILLTVTQHLRQHEAGMIESGIIAGMVVPPMQKSFHVSGFCPDVCLSNNNLPEAGITVFGVGIHSHLLGRRMTLTRHRNGTEPLTIVDDPYYDFNYQQFKLLDKAVTLLPGDSLQMTCLMDSSKVDRVTMGGPSTTSEMCTSYVLYYPRINLTGCYSKPLWDGASPNGNIYQLLDLTKRVEWNEEYSPELNSVNWDDTSKVRGVEDRYLMTSQASCLLANTMNNFTLKRATWMPPTSSPIKGAADSDVGVASSGDKMKVLFVALCTVIAGQR